MATVSVVRRIPPDLTLETTIAPLSRSCAAWAKRFEAKPIVEVEREGRTRRYRATPVPGPHPEVHRLLREKYGIADRWVRFIGPDGDTVLAVRLDPVP